MTMSRDPFPAINEPYRCDCCNETRTSSKYGMGAHVGQHPADGRYECTRCAQCSSMMCADDACAINPKAPRPAPRSIPAGTPFTVHHDAHGYATGTTYHTDWASTPGARMLRRITEEHGTAPDWDAIAPPHPLTVPGALGEPQAVFPGIEPPPVEPQQGALF